MSLQLLQEDPLNILNSTKPIVENLQYISFNSNSLDLISEKISKRLELGLGTAQEGYGILGNLTNDIQLIFLENVVNFCFWNEKGMPKWRVVWPEGNIPSGGWFSLVNCFRRALAEKIEILNPEYLISMNMDATRKLFRMESKVDIPLLNKRTENLQEAGRVLRESFSGNFINATESINFDAVKLVRLIYEKFSSFRDVYKNEGNKIFILKRAQVCAYDISRLAKEYNISFKNTNKFTAFCRLQIATDAKTLWSFRIR